MVKLRVQILSLQHTIFLKRDRVWSRRPHLRGGRFLPPLREIWIRHSLRRCDYHIGKIAPSCSQYNGWTIVPLYCHKGLKGTTMLSML